MLEPSNPYVAVTNSKDNKLEIPLRNGNLSLLDLKKVYPEMRLLFFFASGSVKPCYPEGNTFYPPENGWQSGKLFVLNENESVNDLPCYWKPHNDTASNETNVRVEKKKTPPPELPVVVERKRHVDRLEPKEAAPEEDALKGQKTVNEPDEKTKKLEHLKTSPAFSYPSDIRQYPKQKEDFLEFKGFLWELRGLLLNPLNFLCRDIDPKYPIECSLCVNEKFTFLHLFDEKHLKNNQKKYNSEPRANLEIKNVEMIEHKIRNRAVGYPDLEHPSELNPIRFLGGDPTALLRSLHFVFRLPLFIPHILFSDIQKLILR
uniref:Uncharacterized protein n=1 Tax=Panagrolaimus sp. JU765 TaxID=591449 RepID=A0AC34Q484_9BILA